MVKVYKRITSSILISSMLLTPIYSLNLVNSPTIVYAESIALKNAKAKIDHLTTSLKTNYLGIKNQATWEKYIKQARELIKKINNDEKNEKSILNTRVNKSESLVKALARINQIEKSMTPKSQGGYGNYIGIKNVPTWNEYIRLAKIDLARVDQDIFKKQYDELINRMEQVSTIIKGIEVKFESEYDRIVELYNDAINSNDIKKAAIALQEAQNLETCDKSDALEKEIKNFIANNIW